MLCPGIIVQVSADKILWITYRFPCLPSGTISIFDAQAVPKYQTLFKFTPKKFGGTEMTFDENYYLEVRSWKDKSDMPMRLYCGNSRTCLERPKHDICNVVTEANPYWMVTYRYDDKADPETIACPSEEVGWKISSSGSKSNFGQPAGPNLQGGND